MNKQLVRRIERLEQQLPPNHRLQLVWVTKWLDEHRRDALVPGERIVHDHYDQFPGVILARERITTDPLDTGQRCPLKEDGPAAQ